MARSTCFTMGIFACSSVVKSRATTLVVVALSSDEFNAGKGKKSYFSFEERKHMLEAIRYVDLVIPEDNWEQKMTDVDKYHIDAFVMGDDWEGKFDFLKEKCEVIYLARTPEISTTRIKTELAGS